MPCLSSCLTSYLGITATMRVSLNLPFEIINNIDKRLTRLREKREDSKNKNRNEKRDTTIDSTEIQNIMRD